MNDVTRILNAIESGDRKAAGQLLPLVYDELRKLAAHKLARERAGQTLQPTALVHEAYLRLVGPMDDERWANRGHFFAAAAEAMRRILVEAARRKKRLRHGGELERAAISIANLTAPASLDEDLVAIDEALAHLAEVDAQAALLVKLHFFAGLTMAETASALGVSERKAYNVWAYARAWLFRRLAGDHSAGE